MSSELFFPVRVHREKEHSLVAQFYTTEKNQDILGKNLRSLTLFVELSLIGMPLPLSLV